MKPKIIFFGTHEFGAAILQTLIDSGGYEIVAAITQPDRPVGRKQTITPCAVKQTALDHGIQIYQPESLKNFQFPISNFQLAIVCQYGLIIPKIILEKAELGFINIHPSLLPKYRGASPIQSALINGETETGVSIMLMDEKMDHGPILAQEKISITPSETIHKLREKLEPLASKLLLTALKNYLSGKITPQPQNDAEATFCKMFTRDDGRIDWKKSATEIFNLYRGLSPWPGLWTTLDEKRLKLLSITPQFNQSLTPGKIAIRDQKLFIGTGSGVIEVHELQIEGKSSTDSGSFLTGHREIDGKILE